MTNNVMSKSNLHKSQNNNPNRDDREVVGHRLVPMSADQVDEIARAEGRGKNANVADPRPRCPWCFLKGGTKGNHFCRWRPPTDDRAVGGPVRQVPQYARRRKK